jgi:hypothetical protein
MLFSLNRFQSASAEYSCAPGVISIASAWSATRSM